jgi:hypothetical protein
MKLLIAFIRRHWYWKKRFVIPICFLIALSIAGTILGALFGLKSRVDPIGMFFDVLFNSKTSDRALYCT